MDARRALPPPTEFSLADYLAIIRRQWLWCCAVLAMVVGACWLYTINQEDVFAANSEVLLSDTAAQRTLDPSSQNPWFLNRELSNEISLAMSDTVAAMVGSKLGSVPNIDIEADEEADILSFRAFADAPEQAAIIANTWAEVYVEVKQNEAVQSVVAASGRLQERLEELRSERQELRQPLDDLQDRIALAEEEDEAGLLQTQYDRLADDLRYELDLLTAQSEATVASLADLELQAEVAAVGEARIVQVAAPPTRRANAPLSRNLVLGGIVGLILGVAAALLIDMRDNTIKSASDVQALGLSVLAAIPEAPKATQPELARISQADPEGMYADGFQKLRAAIEFVALGGNLRTVLITSPNASEGKSTTASNLAVALSSVGRTAALVDVDFRRGRVHQIYSISRSPGLADHILGKLELGRIARRVEGAEGLYVIPTGTAPPNPAAFVGLPGFDSALVGVARQVDTVVLDAPPLLAVSDTYTMARSVDGVVLTVRAGSTTRSELTEVLTVLAQVEANVLGVVMIGVKQSESYGGRYYTRSHTEQLQAITTGEAQSRTTGSRRPVSGQVQAADDLSIVYDTGRGNLRTHDTSPVVVGHIGTGGHASVRGGPPTPTMDGSGEVLRLSELDDYQANGNGSQTNGQPKNSRTNGSGYRDGEPTSIFPGMFDR